MIQKHTSGKTLHQIWHEVPPDYYQKGVKKSILQRKWHFGKLRTTLSLAPQDPQKILDVGCASGWFLHEVSKHFKKAECYGIDIYDDAILYGQKKYKHLHLSLADGHTIPFPKNCFDFVICNEVLEHVENPEKVLFEIKRVLKKNGTAVIEMDSGNWMFRAVWYWWTNIRRGVWHDAHIQTFNTQKLERMIKKCGFQILERKEFNYSMAVAFKVCIKN